MTKKETQAAIAVGGVLPILLGAIAIIVQIIAVIAFPILIPVALFLLVKNWKKIFGETK